MKAALLAVVVLLLAKATEASSPIDDSLDTPEKVREEILELHRGKQDVPWNVFAATPNARDVAAVEPGIIAANLTDPTSVQFYVKIGTNIYTMPPMQKVK